MPATLHFTEEDLHQLILTTLEVAYDRCKNNIPIEQTRMELIDALVMFTRPVEQHEADKLGVRL